MEMCIRDREAAKKVSVKGKWLKIGAAAMEMCIRDRFDTAIECADQPIVACWYVINTVILTGCEEVVYHKYYQKLIQLMQTSNENNDLVHLIS